MRTTQYIGLTKRAQDFVADLQPIAGSKNNTLGMFQEEVPLGEWVGELPDFVLHTCGIKECKTFTGVKLPVKVKEIEQASPWSSGPMIFTCLEVEIVGGQKEKAFEWVEDRSIKGREFDYDKGIYWV